MLTPAVLSVASVRTHWHQWAFPPLLQGQPWSHTGAWRSTDGLGVSLEDQAKVIICFSLESLWGPCRPVPWSQSVNRSQIIFPKEAISDIYHWAEGQPSEVEIPPTRALTCCVTLEESPRFFGLLVCTVKDLH